jgi:Spy/CpxP family protein refolding chaperone
MKSIKIILAVLLLVIASTIAGAQPKGNDKGHGPEGPMGHMKQIREKLHLTDQQVSKIEALRSDQMKKMVDLKGNLKKTMIDLKAIKDKDNFSRNDVLAQVDKINKAKDEIAMAKANHLMDLWEILTPEQQKIAKENPQWFNGPKGRKMNQMHRKFNK